jgi:sulfite exporter TauE/SafE
MKNGRLLLLAIIGSVIGGISFFIRPAEHAVIKYMLLAIAALIILLFHLLIFRQVLKKENLDSAERIFWTISIICLPLIGDIIYLIINDAVNRPQELKHAWFF